MLSVGEIKTCQRLNVIDVPLAVIVPRHAGLEQLLDMRLPLCYYIGMKLATIETITSLSPHGNADALEFACVLGFSCIVRKEDQFRVGEKVIFIQPDTVLPDAPWSAVFKAKSSRVKAIKLRGQWSEGIIMRPEAIACPVVGVGDDVSAAIGVTKYDPPLPLDLSAKGLLPFGIPQTDEERYNNCDNIPYGQLVDVTLKIDGQSLSVYQLGDEVGVCGRTLEYKLECDNNFTRNFARLRHGLVDGLCFRGEQYGQGIQNSGNNPHSQLPVGVAFFSVWIIAERRYARKGEAQYAYELLPLLGLPTVPVLERDVVLTPELINKYTNLPSLNGKPFEGVVIQHAGGSFKVINKDYDSKK